MHQYQVFSSIITVYSQILKLSNGDPDTPTLTEAITGPYKAYFTQAMTQYIKELEQHGTWTIVSRN